MRKWKNIVVVLFCLAAIVAVTFVVLPGMTVGRCLVADNGSVLLIDENTPIVLSNRTKNEKLFQNLTIGDKILVIHDGINESYPAGTEAYLVLKLGSGSEADIPAEVTAQLRELGWLAMDTLEPDAAEGSVVMEDPAAIEERIVNSYHYASVSVPKLDGWEYQLTQYTLENFGQIGCGITFYPKGQPVGSITLQYIEFWGVRETQLNEETVFIGEYEALQGIYDDHEMWDYLFIKDRPGNYIFLNTGANAWWEEYKDEAMYIMENAIFAEGTMPKAQAIEIAVRAVAEQKQKGVHEPGYCSFDVKSGAWVIPLHDINNTGVVWDVWVFPDGSTQIEEFMISECG